jgi:hypothetical protein
MRIFRIILNAVPREISYAIEEALVKLKYQVTISIEDSSSHTLARNKLVRAMIKPTIYFLS